MKKVQIALFIVDFINSCAHKKCEDKKRHISFEKIRQIAPKLKCFIQNYRRNINNNIVFIRTVPWQKENLPENINNLYKNPKAQYYSRDKTSFPQEFYLITPEKNNLIIEKNSYDAFTNQKLEEYLTINRIKNIVVTGVFGDGCVMATIVNGFSKGFNFIIIEDLIETTDDPIRQNLLKNLKKFTWPLMYGETISSEDFLLKYNL